MKKRNIVTKIVTVILFSLLIASFAVWGIGDVFRNVGSNTTLAEVGEERIDQTAFSRTFSREVNRLAQRFGGQLNAEQAVALGLADQVLSQMISRALIDQQAADLKLTVTDDQLLRGIEKEPAFRNQAGNFDRAIFVQALQASNLSEGEFLSTLRGDVQRQQLVNAITSAVTAPDNLVETIFAFREERRVAQVATISNDSFSAIEAPGEADLEAFYKESSDNFMAPEYRDITVLTLRAEDLMDEVSVSAEQVREEFESRKDDFGKPERRTIEQIVFQDEATAQQATEKIKTGEDFAAVAEELSGQAPISLGANSHADLLPEMADAAFELDINQVSNPVPSPLGWHILRVTEIEAGREAVFEEVAEELIADQTMRLAIDSMVSIANQLDDEIAGGATIEEAARKLNLRTMAIDAIDRQGNGVVGEPVAGIPTAAEFLDTVFSTKSGEDSLLTEGSDGGYFVLRVNSVTPAAAKSLYEVREEVLAMWRARERGKLAKEKAEALAERLAAQGDFAEIAAAEGLTVTTTEPLTRSENDPRRSLSLELPSKLFQIEPGEATTAATADGYLVAKLIDIRAADASANATALTAVKENLTLALKNDVIDQYLATLRSNYKVTINQGLLDETLASF